MPPPPSQRSSGSSGSQKKSSGPGGGSLSAPVRSDVGGRGQSRPSGPQTRSPKTSGRNADKSNQQSAAVKDARQVAKEQSLVSDARRAGIRSIEVGPQRQSVQIGTGKISQAANTTAADSFYASDPAYQQALQKMRSEREAYRAPTAAKDAVRYSREAPAYNFMTDAEKQIIRDKYGSTPAEGIANLASYVYNNPGEVAGKIVSSVSAPFITGGQYLMGAKPALDRYGNVTPQAAEDITGVALQTGITGGIASLAYPRPAGSIGMFVGPRALPSLRAAYEKGRTLYSRGAGNEDIFQETAKMTPYGVSGLQNIPDSRYWGFEASAPMNIREGVFPSSGLASSAQNAVFGKMLREPTNLGNVAEMGSLSGMYGGKLSDVIVEPSFSPYERGFYTKEGRSFYGQYSPWSNTIDMNTPYSKGFVTRGLYGPDQFRQTLAHEAQHAVANLDDFVPQGYNPKTFKSKFTEAGVSVDPKYLEGAANLAYTGSKGETLARLTQNRLDVPAQQMKDWRTRITAPSDEWFRTFEADEVVRNADKYIRNEIAKREREESLRNGRPSGWDSITLD